MKVWVLTKEYNDYDQYGEYFIAVFSEKPNHSQLTECEVPSHRLRHVINGGGRMDDENEWFHLREVDAQPNASVSISGDEPEYAPRICWAIMVNPDYVNGRGQWSRANQCGYTMDWRDAGRFSRQEAEETAAGSHGKYTAVPLADISEPNAGMNLSGD